jgi:hypothetical protein
VLAPRWEPELAKQDWQENDLVNLGTYEVEIVSSSQAKGPLTVTTATSGSHISKRPVFKPLHPLKTRVAGSLPTQSRSTIIGSSKTGPKQQVSEEEEKHRKRPLAQLPPSPTESTASNEMNAVNMEPCVATNHTFKKKRLLQTTRILHPKRTVNKQQIVKSSQNGISAAESLHFPDAIGTIDLPHSIATALKPHQRTGVTFIWNCVTGNAPVSSHAQRPLDPSYKGGCILADEMGLGKTIMTISAICALYRQKRDSVGSADYLVHSLLDTPLIFFFRNSSSFVPLPWFPTGPMSSISGWEKPANPNESSYKKVAMRHSRKSRFLDNPNPHQFSLFRMTFFVAMFNSFRESRHDC